jgi:hypothetical protein
METLEEGSIRYKVLESARSFKTSWMDLGQSLYSVWKDKLYKQWGYMTFDAFTSKEIGIRKPTAMKLLKSYYFLEKEEPAYLDKERTPLAEAAKLPTIDSVNVLRLAKNKSALDKSDYVSLRREVLDLGKDASAVKKDLTQLIRRREELEPEEARRAKRISSIKRLVTSLKGLRSDIERSKMLPATVLKEISSLINRIELELK